MSVVEGTTIECEKCETTCYINRVKKETSKNCGKLFYSCWKDRGGCGVFALLDEEGKPAAKKAKTVAEPSASTVSSTTPMMFLSLREAERVTGGKIDVLIGAGEAGAEANHLHSASLAHTNLKLDALLGHFNLPIPPCPEEVGSSRSGDSGESPPLTQKRKRERDAALDASDLGDPPPLAIAAEPEPEPGAERVEAPGCGNANCECGDECPCGPSCAC